MSEQSKDIDNDNSGAVEPVSENYILPPEFSHLSAYSGVFDYLLDKLPNVVRSIREIYHVHKNVNARKVVDAAEVAAKSL